MNLAASALLIMAHKFHYATAREPSFAALPLESSSAYESSFGRIGNGSDGTSRISL